MGPAVTSPVVESGAPRWSRNPFALVECVLGEPLFRRSFSLPPAQRGAGLDAALERAASILMADNADALVRGAADGNPVPTALQLFDHLDAKARRFRTVEEALAAAAAHPPAQRLIDRYRRDPQARRWLHWLVPYLVPVDVPPGAGEELPQTISWQQAAADGKAFDYAAGDGPAGIKVDFLDPVQGPIADCYLIAAMIALAWTRPALWSQRVLAADLQSSCRVGLFGPDGTERIVPVSPRVPLAGQVIAFAHSRQERETWPAIYEKAFLAFLDAAVAAKPDPDLADYPTLDHRFFPQQAAARLLPPAAGAAADSFLNGGGRSLFDKLTKHCGAPADVAGAVHRSAVPLHPLVAWTFNATSNGFAAAASHYTARSGLVESHAYAVLGWHRDETKGTDYVILRNPHGLFPETPPPGPDFLAGDWLTGRTEPGLDRVTLNQLGVFGITADKFCKCFLGVGWTPVGP